jgi:intracellular multiplication protein IcmE
MATQDEFNPSQSDEYEEEGARQPTRRKNLVGLWANGRTRFVLILTIIAFALLACVGIYLINRPNPSSRAGGTVDVAPPPKLTRNPGNSNDVTLNRQIEDANADRARQAAKAGETSLPELHGNSDPSRNDPLLVGPPPAAASTAPAPVHVQAYVPPAVTPVTPALTQQQQQDLANARQKAQQLSEERQRVFDSQMSFYLAKLRDNRSPAGFGKQEFDFVGQTPKTGAGSAGGAAAPGAAGQAGAGTAAGNAGSVASTTGATSASNNETKAPAIIQAGTIIPGLLITPLNSDSPGPAMVDITSGPFRGGRALCTAQTQEETIAVRCTRLSLPSTTDIPGAGRSFQIDAYLVDDKYQTNLATNVNHHYLHNIGLVAAAAFVQGYGQAVGRSNSSITTGPFGSTVAYGELSSSQINKTALGQVGQDVGQRLQQQATRPTTVKAVPRHEGEGIPVGLLFMSDF